MADLTRAQAAERLLRDAEIQDANAAEYGDTSDGAIALALRMGADALTREAARTNHGIVDGCPCPGCDPRGAGEHIQELMARVAELERELRRQVAARDALARTASIAGDLWNQLETLNHSGERGCGERGCEACWWAGEYERVVDEVGARLGELFLGASASPLAAGQPAATGGEQS